MHKLEVHSCGRSSFKTSEGYLADKAKLIDYKGYKRQNGAFWPVLLGDIGGFMQF